MWLDFVPNWLAQRYEDPRLSSLISPSGVISLLLGLSMIAIVIPSLFFFVGSKVESQVVTDQAQYIVDGLTQDAIDFLTPAQKVKASALIQEYFQAPDMSAADAKVASQNEALLKKAYSAIGIGVGAAIGAIIFILLISAGSSKAVPGFILRDIVVENLFISGGIALTELAVLFLIGRHYKSAQVNFVKLMIVEQLQAFAGAPP